MAAARDKEKQEDDPVEQVVANLNNAIDDLELADNELDQDLDEIKQSAASKQEPNQSTASPTPSPIQDDSQTMADNKDQSEKQDTSSSASPSSSQKADNQNSDNADNISGKNNTSDINAPSTSNYNSNKQQADTSAQDETNDDEQRTTEVYRRPQEDKPSN